MRSTHYEINNPPAESSTSEALVARLLRDRERPKKGLSAIVLQSGIIPLNLRCGVCWKDLDLEVVDLLSFYNTGAVKLSGNVCWEDPGVKFDEQDLMLVSPYTANVAASIATFSNQQIFAMPETYSFDVLYPTGLNFAASVIDRAPKPTPYLGSAYKIDNATKASSFIEQNQLTDILVQAIEPLNKAFGESLTKTLTVVEDDEGSRTLFCLVAFTGSPKDARKALDAFDRNWWLMNARRFVGKLNFDFELA